MHPKELWFGAMEPDMTGDQEMVTEIHPEEDSFSMQQMHSGVLCESEVLLARELPEEHDEESENRMLLVTVSAMDVDDDKPPVIELVENGMLPASGAEDLEEADRAHHHEEGFETVLTDGCRDEFEEVHGVIEHTEKVMLSNVGLAQDFDEVHGANDVGEHGMLVHRGPVMDVGGGDGANVQCGDILLENMELAQEFEEVHGENDHSETSILPGMGPVQELEEAHGANECSVLAMLSSKTSMQDLERAHDGSGASDNAMVAASRSAQDFEEAHGEHAHIENLMLTTMSTAQTVEEARGIDEHDQNVMPLSSELTTEIEGAHRTSWQSESAISHTTECARDLGEAQMAYGHRENELLLSMESAKEFGESHGVNEFIEKTMLLTTLLKQKVEEMDRTNDNDDNSTLLTTGSAQDDEEESGAIVQSGNRDPERRRKFALIASALVAAMSAVSAALVSVQQILSLLGLSPGMDGLLSSESQSGRRIGVGESSHIYYWRSWRSFNDAQDNLRMLYFLLLIRRRCADVPKQMSSAWYIKPRSVQWFVYFIDSIPREDPERFMQYFRVSPDLFYHICELVSDQMLTDPPSALRVLPNRVLSVERQVALALRRLATGDQFLGIAELFGVSKSTAVKVTWKFIQALNHKGKQHLVWPQGERLQQVKDGFKSRWGFPNCCGAVARTYFTVEFPRGEDTAAYYDYKHHVSVSMQAIADQDLRFLDVVAGWPGGIQDSRLLHKSKFFRTSVYRENRLNGTEFRCADGTLLKEYILGDAGYPLYEWLIAPYPKGSSGPLDEFNRRHLSARMCAERAFSRLKGTWRILSRILWKPRKERIGPMITACCILHNLIIDRADRLNPQVYEGVSPRPGGYESVAVPTRAFFEGGPEARDVIFNEVMRA